MNEKICRKLLQLSFQHSENLHIPQLSSVKRRLTAQLLVAVLTVPRTAELSRSKTAPDFFSNASRKGPRQTSAKLTHKSVSPSNSKASNPEQDLQDEPTRAVDWFIMPYESPAYRLAALLAISPQAAGVHPPIDIIQENSRNRPRQPPFLLNLSLKRL